MKERIAIAELEYLGLSLRVINALEENLKIIWVDELQKYSRKELEDAKQLGAGAIKSINSCLSRLHELDDYKTRWHEGSEKVEFYKEQLKK